MLHICLRFINPDRSRHHELVILSLMGHSNNGRLNEKSMSDVEIRKCIVVGSNRWKILSSKIKTVSVDHK